MTDRAREGKGDEMVDSEQKNILGVWGECRLCFDELGRLPLWAVDLRYPTTVSKVLCGGY